MRCLFVLLLGLAMSSALLAGCVSGAQTQSDQMRPAIGECSKNDSCARSQFNAYRARIQTPLQRRAGIQECVAIVAAPAASRWRTPPNAVKYCTRYVNDVATGRLTYDKIHGRGPQKGYDYVNDKIVTRPAK